MDDDYPGSKPAPEGRGNVFLFFFFFQEWEEMSNSAFTVVQLPVLKGLGNTVQTAQTQRPDPGDGWAADTPLPPKTSMRGYAEVLSQGTPPWVSHALSISRARTCQCVSVSRG